MPSQTRPDTRTKLLDAAKTLVDRQGFSATSIEQIIAAVGVTKGSFFYHFKSKGDLAQALIDRFAERDGELLASSMERAEKLSDDPLQQLLIFIGLMIEVAEGLDTEDQPGCLFATYCFEGDQFDQATKQVIADAIQKWTDVIAAKLHAAAEQHPTTRDVDFVSLADLFSVIFEGAFVLARTFEGRGIFAAQLRQYRTYVQLLFGI